MENTNFIGVDMGGTKIHAAKIEQGNLLKESKIATPANENENVVIDALITAIEAVFDSTCEGIGIGVPSVVDTESGIVYDVCAIPSWKEVHLKHILENHFHRPVYINNDSNCFALGEKHYGKGKDYSNLVGITLGTGLGTGLILDDKLYNGTNCGAGEIGCFPYKDSQLEDYCAKRFFENQYKTDGFAAYQNAQKNDKLALEIFKDLGKNIGYAIKLIVLAYDPQIVIIGGSVSESFPFFIDSLRNSLHDFPYQNSINKLIITKSELNNSAVLGAAALNLQNNFQK